MVELEPLATALRKELGAPPEAWQEARRARFRAYLRETPRPTWIRFAPWVTASLALFGVLIWLALPLRSEPRVERWLVAEEQREPFRLDEGSSITLTPGARGRLTADASSVRFDLHQGRASFDVVPGRRRAWTISAGKNEVRVVGTRFSVFYGTAEAFEVEVERGIVSVRVPDRKASVELGAGERLSGGPGHFEVAQGATKARSGAASSDGAQQKAPSVEEQAPPPAGPSTSSTAGDDWRARYREGKYSESLALVRASGFDKRLGELSPGVLAELADAARLGGDPRLAARALSTLLRRFPGSAEARDGKFLLGRVHALSGDRTAAIAEFEGYLRNGESALYANEAVGRLMELYSVSGDSERAQAMARRYLERAPNGPYQRLARSLVTQRR